jgi:hypothetical protein
MTTDEAKQLLAVYRPGGSDDEDPRFAEALQKREDDPELALWFAEQRSFDAKFTDALGATPVPSDLRSALLTDTQLLRPSFRKPVAVRLAWAACVVGLAVISISLGVSRLKSGRFHDFRHELVQNAWGETAHLDYKSSDLTRIRRWLVRQGALDEFTVPAALANASIQGCRLVKSKGHLVPMLCLVDESRHIHLFITNEAQLAGSPQPGTPEFAECGAWKTASWQDKDRLYILTGMNYTRFMNTFRKARRWTITG